LALESEPGVSLTRSEYQRLTGVGRSQAASDLADLVSAGTLIRVGGGRSTRYVLAHKPASQRHWTPDRIRRELDMFCAGRGTWPTAREFKDAGRGDLYVAASRYGGVAHWANELGLERLDRPRAEGERVGVPLRRRPAWGFAAAFVSGALAAAAITAIVVTHHFESGGTTAAKAAATQQTRTIVHELFRPPYAAPNLATARPAPRAERRGRKPTTRLTSRAQTKPAPKISRVSEPLQTTSEQAAQTASETLATATVEHSGGPAPLPAPTGHPAPSPLKAP
jgi:hypothetical protein